LLLALDAPVLAWIQDASVLARRRVAGKICVDNGRDATVDK
jgi:hypothetical protein